MKEQNAMHEKYENENSYAKCMRGLGSELVSLVPLFLSLAFFKLLIRLVPYLIHLLLVNLGKDSLKLPLLIGFPESLSLKGFSNGFL